jgi:hypothetical protein
MDIAAKQEGFLCKQPSPLFIGAAPPAGRAVQAVASVNAN